MSKKPHKVDEPQAAYPAKKAAKAAAPAAKVETARTRYMDDATFKKASAKVFKVHHELFRKLAQ